MAAAAEAGGFAERARHALVAGCDMVLVCNNPEGVVEVIEALDTHAEPATQMRLIRMHGRKTCNREQLRMDVRWRNAIDAIAGYEDNPVLDLDLST
jgi:beta-N-acetylhexosaminidase